MDIIQFAWLAIPGLYFLIALWGFLERLGKSSRKQNPGDFMRQGFFILACVGITFVLDAHVLESLTALAPDFLPLILVRLLALPIVLLIAALLLGGTTPQSLKRDKYKKPKRN